MKKILAILMIIAGCALNATGQTVAFKSAVFSSASADSAIKIQFSGAVAHRIIWTTTGTVSSCSVKLEKSADGSTWSDLIAAQTCTSNGYSTITTGSANYVRLNVTVLAGGGTVGVVLNSWAWNVEAGLTYPLQAPNGTAAAPSYSFVNFTNTGWYIDASISPYLSLGGTKRYTFNYQGFTLHSNGGFLGIGADTGAADVMLFREAANIFGQRNGGVAGTPVPQGYRLYNFYTDSANYERVELLWAANDFYISQASLGTGVGRNVRIYAGGNLYFGSGGAGPRWYVQGGGGHFYAQTDNAYDIGNNGANRPRNVYIGTSVVTPTIAITTTTTPANSAAACTANTIWSDGSYIYYCSASGNIKRTAPLATF